MNELIGKLIVDHSDTIKTWFHNLHYECEAKKKIRPTFITDCALHTENIPFDKLNTKPFLEYVESSNSIFVRIYVHGVANVCKQVCTESYAVHKPDSKSRNNSIIYLVQPYYNVLFNNT